MGNSEKKLLIVPYGIETYIGCFLLFDSCLLIVPYGIETICNGKFDQVSDAFNCTLWN